MKDAWQLVGSIILLVVGIALAVSGNEFVDFLKGI